MLSLVRNIKFNQVKQLTKRTVATINIGDVTETIVTREDYPKDKCRQIMGNQCVSIIGYGPQGCGQSLNLRDNGFNVIVGTRKGASYDKALEDGWEEGKNLFEIEEATEKGQVVQYLLSDAGQIAAWPTVLPHLTEGKTLYFSHGFATTFSDKTGIEPPENIDVVLVAPKGAGMTVRNEFLKGKGINVSYAIYQDHTGNAKDTCLSLAFGIGCGHAFETTFEKEAISDLVGERSVLMGGIQGFFKAQYDVLRARGHSPSEAYNETVEEALVSLYPLISEKGMDWLYANCSTTAQRGALDWAHRFEEVIKPVIEECYDSVESGVEADVVIEANSFPGYRSRLDQELAEMKNQELWRTAEQLRKLRP